MWVLLGVWVKWEGIVWVLVKDVGVVGKVYEKGG